MTQDVFHRLKAHYASIAKELRSVAEEAGLLVNPTAVGAEREEVYRTFLERHLPKMCDVFLGGYLFDLNGNTSSQIDVLVTGGNSPRFGLPSGNRHIAPLEGSIAVAEIKSRLDGDSLKDALDECASIPPMPKQTGIVPPYLKVPKDRWRDTPYKIIFAYNGLNASTICNHITGYYNQHAQIPTARRPNVIHVLGKYMIIRTTPGMTVTNPDGRPDVNQPGIGQYKTFITSPDISAMGWILNEVQQQASLGNHLLWKYGEWHNKVMDRVQRESAE